jgi:hypothetical protein
MTSKIKVDNIENQCGGAVVTKCGATTTISGSVVKADDIQAADGGNLINQCGTTITLGASGDTINLASGASQTGFGRTGTVNWDTTPKTSTVTAANGVGYFVDTTSGSVTVNLPAGSAGAIVAIADYANTADTNKIVVNANGTEKIQGVASNPFEITVEGGSVTLVYVDSTQGWRPTDASTAAAITENSVFITATGGSIATSGDYKIHTFTGPGTFCVSAGSGPVAKLDYVVVAGGGGAGGSTNPGGGGAGGGAGGFREGYNPGSYTASPLATTALPVSVQGYPITVGAGGTGKGPGGYVNGTGSNSIFSTITSTGGGDGGMNNPTSRPVATIGSNGTPSTSSYVGGSGGSGGGGGFFTNFGGKGNEPPVSPSQGNSGGNGAGGPQYSGGGGGGAGAVGSNAPSGSGANGGAGVTSSITGSPVTRAGGGGGASSNSSDGSGGSGGGGSGTSPGGTGGAGSANTGGGGGAGGSTTNATGGAGGSGIVIIRYKFQ